MTSFTETATLKVVDQATKEIRGINRELKKLDKTAAALRKTLGNIGSVKVNTGQLSQATRKITQMGTAARNLKKDLQLSGNVRLQSIDRALGKMKQLEAQARSTANAVARIGAGVRVPGMPGARGGRGGGGHGGGGAVTVQYGGLQSFLHGFTARLGSTIESAIVSGFAKGARATDLAQNRQRILGFTPEQRAANNRTATDIAGRNRGFSRAQVLTTMGEIGPSVGNNPEATAKVTEMILEYSKALMAAGATSEEATDNLQKLSKAMGMTSALLDNDGKFDEAATRRMIDVIVQETITGGAEMTPELIAQLAKYSRTTGKTLDQEGWRTLLFLGEDYGSSAGVGLNQMVKQLTGERVQKKQLANQMKYGITGSREIETGKVGGKKSTEIVAGDTVDEGLLRSNPAAWIRKVLFPIMAKNNIDRTDNVQVGKFVGEITSDRTASDILMTLITNMGEVEQRRKIAQDRGDVDLDAILNDSLVARWDDATTQLISAVGETANSFKTVLIPVLNMVSDSARGIAAFLAGNDGQGNPLVAATVAGGAAATAFGVYKGGSMLMNGFGLQASAVALDGSAAALTRAAISLGASGTASNVAGAAAGGAGAVARKGVNWGAIAKTAGYVSIITGLLTAVDMYANDGRASKKGEANVNDFVAMTDAVTNTVTQKLTSGDSALTRPLYQTIIDAIKGEGKSSRLADTEAAISQIKSDITQSGNDPAYAASRQAELLGLEQFATTLRDENANAAENMRVAFTSGSETIVAGIDGSANSFGSTVAGLLQSGATAFGQAAAAAFNASAQAVVADIRVKQAPDTGQNSNGAR